MKISEAIELMENHLSNLRQLEEQYGDRDIVKEYQLKLDFGDSGAIWINELGISLVGSFGVRYLRADSNFADFVTGE